jgi:[ribosomal protein S5]-alanine N-acetyltransferase
LCTPRYVLTQCCCVPDGPERRNHGQHRVCARTREPFRMQESSGVGRRVYLRPPRIEDAQQFLSLTKGSRRLHRPWVSPPADLASFTAYVERNRADDFRGFLACRRADGAIVGVVNLSQVFRGSFENACIGFYGFSPFVRQGYMTEAVALALRHAFRTMRLHRVEANLQPANHASRALVERLGFRLEGFSPRYLRIAGRWRDHERWAILAEEWRARPTSSRTI